MGVWLKSIQAVLVSRKTEVPYGKVWQDIHRELGVGTPTGRRLLLSPDDIETLENEYRLQTGGASLGANLRGDRTAMAGITPNEKASPGQVFSRYLRVAAADDMLYFKHQGQVLACRQPPDSYLAVSHETLPVISRANYDRVLVIENGNLMENLSALKAILPATYATRTLFVYRGHDNAMPHVYRLLETLSDDLVMGVFCDYDAAGMRIAMTEFIARAPSGVELVVPRLDEAQCRPCNKSGLFYEQLDLLYQMQRQPSLYAPILPALNDIAAGKWALSQEGMVAHRIPLQALTIRTHRASPKGQGIPAD